VPNWFESHAYVANWLLVPLSVIPPIVFRAKQRQFARMDWLRLVLTLLVFSGFAVAITPIFDTDARSFGKYMATVLLFALIVAFRTED